jgi:PAS domain S-box-containing protein
MAKILVVDDEETIRFAFESFLTDAGHAVALAASVDEAQRVIAESAFDLVFADIILDDRTGIEVLRAVREGRSSCPVVMITGHPTLETASEAVRLGAFDYVPKPVRQRTLLDVAERALKHKALVDEKERYRLRLEAIMRSVRDAIITVDRDMVVTGVNEAAREICGLSRDAIGKRLRSFPHAFRDECLDLLARTVKGVETDGALRVECQPENGPKRLVTIVASPLLDEQALISGAVMVVKDETRLDRLERDLEERRQFHNIVGKSRQMQQIYSLVEGLANVPTTVLITGETGTGKELVAAALHHRGDRAGKPFVKVNCAALPENLLESELFGHVKGAFTGAFQNKIGRFERASGGTIFLDEIGDISPAVQVRLLRVLQEGEFERVGDSSPMKVDVRVVAATNKDLREKAKRGEFRDDLYYRLKVVEIHLPPLRERKEDMPLLIEHFLRKFNARFGKEISSVTADVRKVLMDYAWPGNVRELEHAFEHAFIVCSQSAITVDDLPPELWNIPAAEQPTAGGASPVDREGITSALEKTGWNKAKAARLLGISRQTMYRKIEEYGIPSLPALSSEERELSEGEHNRTVPATHSS